MENAEDDQFVRLNIAGSGRIPYLVVLEPEDLQAGSILLIACTGRGANITTRRRSTLAALSREPGIGRLAPAATELQMDPLILGRGLLVAQPPAVRPTPSYSLQSFRS